MSLRSLRDTCASQRLPEFTTLAADEEEDVGLPGAVPPAEAGPSWPATKGSGASPRAGDVVLCRPKKHSAPVISFSPTEADAGLQRSHTWSFSSATHRRRPQLFARLPRMAEARPFAEFARPPLETLEVEREVSGLSEQSDTTSPGSPFSFLSSLGPERNSFSMLSNAGSDCFDEALAPVLPTRLQRQKSVRFLLPEELEAEEALAAAAATAAEKARRPASPEGSPAASPAASPVVVPPLALIPEKLNSALPAVPVLRVSAKSTPPKPQMRLCGPGVNVRKLAAGKAWAEQSSGGPATAANDESV